MPAKPSLTLALQGSGRVLVHADQGGLHASFSLEAITV